MNNLNSLNLILPPLVGIILKPVEVEEIEEEEKPVEMVEKEKKARVST